MASRKQSVPPESVPESSLGAELRRATQAFDDLKACAASEVSLVRCRSRLAERELVSGLTAVAHRMGFVSACLSLRGGGLGALDEVVRRLIESLCAPDTEAAAALAAKQGSTSQQLKLFQEGKLGLLSLLEAYAKSNGQSAESLLEIEIAAQGADGDVAALALSIVRSCSQPRSERRYFQAWLAGTEMPREDAQAIARASLSPRTAKRALAELTRLIKALGYSGCVFFLIEGETITQRPPRQREKAYTVLRELVDNLDGSGGMVATRMVLTGGAALFEGPKSLGTLEPLLGRLRPVTSPGVAPPHRPGVRLGGFEKESLAAYVPHGLSKKKVRGARAIIRASQGLPPTEAITSMSVGYRHIDATINRLLKYSAISGSVFTVLTGDYGSGKTHLLMHLTERALEEQRPVFRLSLERLNFDLGNPQRHFGRLLEQSTLPLRHRPSAQTRARVWTATDRKVKDLLRILEEIEDEGSDASFSAKKARLVAKRAKNTPRALTSFLLGKDLQRKLGTKSYRQSAYSRFLLWLELLKRLDGCLGPVVLIDEAENLYTSGLSKAERRTALRSLSFYCGGALPDACVVLAITPGALGKLQQESAELLETIAEQRTVLPSEDALMLRRRLTQVQPQAVPEFKRSHRIQLANKVRQTHQAVRGVIDDQGWAAAVKTLTQAEAPPRVLVRALMDRLEQTWWHQKVGG